MEEKYGMNDRERDFYERNIENPVNLDHSNGFTISGDIKSYNIHNGIVKLTNFIVKDYKPDGTSEFIESQEEMEYDTSMIKGRHVTTRENRLGRIVNYNKNLEIEELEKEKKLRDFREQNNNIRRPNN